MFSTIRAAAPRSGFGVSPSRTSGAVPPGVAARAAAPGGAVTAARRRRWPAPASRCGVVAVGGPRRVRRRGRSRRRTPATTAPPSRDPPRTGGTSRRRGRSSGRDPRTCRSHSGGYRSPGWRGPGQPRTSSTVWNARSSDWRAFSRGSHMRLVARLEVGRRAPSSVAAEALGDVVAGELDVHAARPHAGGVAHAEEARAARASRRRSGGSCSRSRG